VILAVKISKKKGCRKEIKSPIAEGGAVSPKNVFVQK